MSKKIKVFPLYIVFLEIIQTMEGYWRGPYNVWVNNNVKVVIDEDGTNTLYNTPHGFLKSQCGVINPVTEDEWKAKYAFKTKDDEWFYKAVLSED